MDIHPFLVHFPIGLLTTSFLFDLAALIFRRDSLTAAAWWTQLAGTLGILGAAFTGLAAGNSQVFAGLAQDLSQSHEQWALVSASIFAALTFWRAGKRKVMTGRSRALFLAAFALGIVLLWYVGWEGGELVFRYGAGSVR